MHPIDLGRLDYPAVREHLTNADRRTKAGARFIFDALDIPYPDYLQRKPAGRPFAKGVMEAYRKDHPEALYDMTLRRSRECEARLPNRDAR